MTPQFACYSRWHPRPNRQTTTLLESTSSRTAVCVLFICVISCCWFTDDLITAKPDDAYVESLIRDYDCRNIVNKDLVSKMLLAEHGIRMGCVVLFLLF